MSIKQRLTLMNFLQFFTYGLWVITFGAYAMKTLHFTGTQVGAIYGTMGIASIFMPGVIGIIADRWISAERLYSLCHFIGALALIAASLSVNPDMMFWAMMLNSLVYMPSIPLAISISYRVINDNGYNVVSVYPPIRVWGTIGFILALWTISMSGLELSVSQLYFASGSALLLSIYSLTLPKCPPLATTKKGSWVSQLGLDAFVLFKQSRMAIFFIFAILVGVALQINNTFCSIFLHDFDANPLFRDSFGVTHSAMLLSISQISETAFILVIPFFLRKFGIKVVILMSIIAWVLRFGLLAFGNPGSGVWMLMLSMVVYGSAFDFFNIACSLFVEKEAPGKIRASAQGLFFIMAGGIGGFAGSFGGGVIIDFFTKAGNVAVRDWTVIWLVFAVYALVVGVLFALLFKQKHNAQDFENIQH